MDLEQPPHHWIPLPATHDPIREGSKNCRNPAGHHGSFAASAVEACYQLSITAADMIDHDFMRGFVKLYALWRASQSAVYGLEIIEEMRDLGFKLSPGTVYPTLHALLEEGDVTVKERKVNGKLRRVYRATRKGKKEAVEVIERLSFLVRKVFH